MRTMLLLIVLLAGVASLQIEAAWAQSSTIALEGNSYYLDYDYPAPALEISQAKPETLQVYAEISSNLGGITGAEFTIAGLPADWLFTLIKPPAANVFFGDPFGERVNVAFPNCQMGIAENSGFLHRRVHLMSAIIVATSDITDQRLQVNSGNPPSNPNWYSPTVTRCDADVTGYASYGVGLVINPRTVAIESQSWSQIKKLFRN